MKYGYMVQDARRTLFQCEPKFDTMDEAMIEARDCVRNMMSDPVGNVVLYVVEQRRAKLWNEGTQDWQTTQW